MRDTHHAHFTNIQGSLGKVSLRIVWAEAESCAHERYAPHIFVPFFRFCFLR